MTYNRLLNRSLQIPRGITVLTGLALLATGIATPASAQTQMPMDWHMSWPMTLGMAAFCILLLVVLVLGAAALIKYLFFR